MADIIEFPNKQQHPGESMYAEGVWECECGCQEFILYVSGYAVCSQCDNVILSPDEILPDDDNDAE